MLSESLDLCSPSRGAADILRSRWVALAKEGLWQGLSVGILACRSFLGFFSVLAVGSCKKDHKPCHGEYGVLRAGLLCYPFCWDLNGP